MSPRPPSLEPNASEREREIVILTETQRDLKRDLRAFKADYVSADAEDVIRALRKRQRGLNDKANATHPVVVHCSPFS